MPLPLQVIGELLGVPAGAPPARWPSGRGLGGASTTPGCGRRASTRGRTSWSGSPSSTSSPSSAGGSHKETCHRADSGRAGWPSAHRGRAGLVPRADPRCRDRHDPQLLLRRDARDDREPRPMRATPRRSFAGPDCSRGVRPLGHAVHALPANRHPDTEIGDVKVRSGDAVVTWFTSGNRDEDVFSDPFQFDVARDPNPHQGFGGGGPHYCFGAGLARLELRC